MIYIKNSTEIEKIKKACQIWKEVKTTITPFIKEGITTLEINNIIKNEILSHNATPTFLGYAGFPYDVCISVNDELIHGFPSNYKLKQGDMITIDMGVTYGGHVCDSAFTIIIGDNHEAKKISEATYKSLIQSINEVKPGNYVGDISYTIKSVAKKYGYEVIKDFTGHGCGNQLHEEPSIPCYGDKNTGSRLVPGMTLCIEPMLMTGSDQYTTDKNGWTIRSKNHKLTCHWEHMVLVTETSCEILTL